MLSILIQLFLNRIIFGYYASRKIELDELISRPSILQWLSLCVFIPIQEEIMYRYAFYHLLEKYIDNIMTINIVNGIFFGLLHASNGLVVKMKPLDYLMIILANGHLGYLLAVLHDNIFLCMLIHGLYNFIGISIVLYASKGIKDDKVINNIYIYTRPRRRASSLGYVTDYKFVHTIDKSKVNKEILDMREKYEKSKHKKLQKTLKAVV